MITFYDYFISFFFQLLVFNESFDEDEIISWFTVWLDGGRFRETTEIYFV